MSKKNAAASASKKKKGEAKPAATTEEVVVTEQTNNGITTTTDLATTTTTQEEPSQDQQQGNDDDDDDIDNDNSTMSIKRILGIVGIVLISILIKILIDYGLLFTSIEYNDQGCFLLPEIQPGSEDIVIVDNTLAIVSSGDLSRIFFKSPSKPRESQLWAIHYSDDDESKITTSKIDIEWNDNDDSASPLLNTKSKSTFGPHGLHYSNSTNRLYAVSHSCGSEVVQPESTIEVFELVRSQDESSSSIKLVHETSVKSSKFLLGAINNVVEGASYGELYVTQWLSNAMSPRCLGNADEIRDDINIATKMVLTRSTKVYRCAYGPTGKTSCRVVADNFKVANGITMNPSKTQVYVVDAADHYVYIFDRIKESGKLKRYGKIPVPHGMDNIEYDVASNKLTLSSSPLMYQCILKLAGLQSQQVSGGMTTIELLSSTEEQQEIAKKVLGSSDDANDEFDDEFDSRNNNKGNKGRNSNNRKYIMEDILFHDGSKLSMISSAVFFNKYILLGSPPSDGVLVCPIPTKPIKTTEGIMLLK